MFFKKPIALTHTVEVEIPDLEAATKPVFDEAKRILRTVGLALAVGIPSVIIFALAARVGAEVLVDHLTDPPVE